MKKVFLAICLFCASAYTQANADGAKWNDAEWDRWADLYELNCSK